MTSVLVFDELLYNPLTFGWDDLYSVDNNFAKKWNSFVKSYKSASYGGDLMISEFNDIINAGNVTKVNKDDYIFKS